MSPPLGDVCLMPKMFLPTDVLLGTQSEKGVNGSPVEAAGKY